MINDRHNNRNRTPFVCVFAGCRRSENAIVPRAQRAAAICWWSAFWANASVGTGCNRRRAKSEWNFIYRTNQVEGSTRSGTDQFVFSGIRQSISHCSAPWIGSIKTVLVLKSKATIVQLSRLESMRNASPYRTPCEEMGKHVEATLSSVCSAHCLSIFGENFRSMCASLATTRALMGNY